ncbi:Putative major facilitator superfamily, MFS transporter superfamily [Septoria linicola]|uniref:Major facilitator superfamily, MFS transporter superfamily n=1 Tax=Septoria linicola TaxID=215465 RepID=A0A9Q9B9D7_9PEZI|nr:Putative major facilitator superfamily, MFS transporter superfamily [Septoria linicola]
MENSLYDLEASLHSTSSLSSDRSETAKKEDYCSSVNRNDSTATIKRSVDIPLRVHEALHAKGLSANALGVVSWRDSTSAHPRQWPFLRKCYDSAVICLMEFVMTVVSNIGSSIVPYALPQLDISSSVLGLFYFTTLYLLGQALGGLVFPPLAESFGGQTIYTTCTIGFAACCLIIGACPSVPVIIIGRFVSGFLSAMPAVVACGSIENIWDTKAHLGWQWLFYFAAILGGVLTILCTFMRESRPSQLLRLRVHDISHDTNFHKLTVDPIDAEPTARSFIRDSLTMPLRLSSTEPIVFLTSIMGATVYDVIYLFTAAIPEVYTKSFGFTATQASLVFIAIVTSNSNTNTQAIEPEDKLFGFYIAAPILAIGLWLFSLTTPPLIHPSVNPYLSISSLALFGYAVVEFDNILSGYLCDTYTSRTASALAPMSSLRAVLSGTFPLFGTQGFQQLGAHRAMFILAGVATGFCGVAWVFGRYGRILRQRSKFVQ